jgi:peptidoglycan/LPS O-acetylase OafA/YrhL
MSSVVGLDTLRFFAAGWVALFHGARFPLDKIMVDDSIFAHILIALNNGLFNGVASVLLFFVISGFVIHRAAVGRQKLGTGRFLLRRLTRIVPPVVIIYLVCQYAGPDYVASLTRVLWSVYCEIAYYLLYPLLFPAFRRGWTLHVLVLTSIAAAVVLLSLRPLLYYWEAPMPQLIVIGLPIWILGCLLAERQGCLQAAISGPSKIWLWRIGAVVLSAGLKVPVTHGPFRIGYPESHWIIGLYAYCWIAREIEIYRYHPVPRWSEAAGRASFSLYLVHEPVMQIFNMSQAPAASLHAGMGALLWVSQLVAIGVATALFHLIVEAPFHRLARNFSKPRPICGEIAIMQQPPRAA